MSKCQVCNEEVDEVYAKCDTSNNWIFGHKACVIKDLTTVNSMHPFADEAEINRLNNERDLLIQSLSEYAIPEDEQRFIIRKIKNISEKLVEKARYMKDLK